MTTAEQWHTHWWRIHQNALDTGETPENAAVLADHDTVEQFGPEPPEAATGRCGPRARSGDGS